MRLTRALLVVVIVILLQFIPFYISLACPTKSLQNEHGDVFDDWGVCRTNCTGEDGYFQEIYTEPHWPPESFRPQIVFESLGQYADTAYRLGQEFAKEYPDKSQRAEQIFYFVRDNVQYKTNLAQFGYKDFAQNADEVANTIENKGPAYGDCKAMAVLLAVMFYGGGLRSAIVDCPEHAGVVVYLPGYTRANVDLVVNGEPGWVWAEATGKTNPFGWFPEGQLGGPLLNYEITAEPISLQPPITLAVCPSELSFSATVGGQNPESQTLAVENSGNGTMQWSVTGNAPWLSVTPASGTYDGETNYVTVSADISGMDAGNYDSTITVSAPNASNSPEIIPVYLNVATTAVGNEGKATIALSPSDFSFSTTLGGQNPASQSLSISNSGQGPMQ